MPTKSKFDYDNPDFYDAIHALASIGCTDAEIASGISELSGTERRNYPGDIWPDLPQLNPTTFGRMKNGKYSKWTDEENKSRSERICRVLARARVKINIIIREVLIKLALGECTSNVRRYRQIFGLCECKGNDASCTKCSGTGRFAITPKQLLMEEEHGYPPSIQAIEMWLRHHDPEWRRIDLKRHEENICEDMQVTGIDIQVTYISKKDIESNNEKESTVRGSPES